MKRTIFTLLFIFACIQFPIHATIDEDFVDNYNFFSPAFLKMKNLTIGKEGLTLEEGKKRGYFLSTIAVTKIEFNAMSIHWVSKMSEGSKIQLDIRVQDQKGTWQRWEKISKSQQDLQFKSSNIAYQYRIQLQGPCSMKKLSVFYDKIKEKMLHVQPKPLYLESQKRISKPSIVSRSAWGARPPKSGYSYHTPRMITIHHTYRPKASSYNGSSSIRSIQNYHMDTNGWNDIGYHFLIGTYPSSGNTSIYQGRPENVIGAHTGGKNTNNVGVNVVGDYSVENLHQNSYSTLIRLLAWLCSHYNIDPNHIYGHRDFGSTACPGDKLYILLPKIRSDVSAQIR